MREEEAVGSAWSLGEIILAVREDDGSKLWLEWAGSDADLRIPVGLDEGPIGMSELVSNTGLLPTFFADMLSGPIKSCNFLRGSHPSSFLLS